MPLIAKLVVVGGDVKTTEINLKLPSTIGRGRGTAIVLPHPLVSRQHCEIFESGGQLMVKDLGSLNGTFVNNERITESILGPGELLTVGTVTFRAVYQAEGGRATADSTLKERPGEKTVKVNKATTLAASAKRDEKPANQDSAPLEFDFASAGGAPAGNDPGGPTHVTDRLEPKKPKGNTAKTGEAKPKKTSAKAPPPAEESSSDFESSDADSSERVSSSSDEDLNDFLDSLKD